MSYYGTGFPPGVTPMTPPLVYGNPGMPYQPGPAGPMASMTPPTFAPQAGGYPGYPPYGVGPMMTGNGSPPTDIYVRRPC